MAASETLSVRLTLETRRVLAEAAITHDRAGASALAREILERWAHETMERSRHTSTNEAMAYLERHDGDWGDDPADFFDMPS